MKQKIAVFSILMNVILATAKIVVGFVFSSSAILAEGFHSLTDIFSSIIGYFGIRFSQRPIDQKHPYGYYKFEVLSGIVITIILLSTGLGIIFGAYTKFSNSTEVKFSYLTFCVMVLSVIINYVTSKIKIYYGKKENSLTLLSDGTHDKADVWASFVVLMGLFLSKHWIYIDPILAIVVGLYIIKESFILGREATDSLLDVSAGEVIENKIRFLAQEENIEILSLKTQKKGSIVTANLEIKIVGDLKTEEAVNISENLRQKLMRIIESLKYVSIQITSYEILTNFYKPDFGQSFGWQRKGKQINKTEKSLGKGPSGDCVCPKCNYTVSHTQGVPCSNVKCPKCVINLERK